MKNSTVKYVFLNVRKELKKNVFYRITDFKKSWPQIAEQYQKDIYFMILLLNYMPTTEVIYFPSWKKIIEKHVSMLLKGLSRWLIERRLKNISKACVYSGSLDKLVTTNISWNSTIFVAEVLMTCLSTMFFLGL